MSDVKLPVLYVILDLRASADMEEPDCESDSLNTDNINLAWRQGWIINLAATTSDWIITMAVDTFVSSFID